MLGEAANDVSDKIRTRFCKFADKTLGAVAFHCITINDVSDKIRHGLLPRQMIPINSQSIEDTRFDPQKFGNPAPRNFPCAGTHCAKLMASIAGTIAHRTHCIHHTYRTHRIHGGRSRGKEIIAVERNRRGGKKSSSGNHRMAEMIV